MTTQITDHVAEAIARQTEQFKGKVRVEQLITILVEPIQRFEDVAWRVLTERSVSAAVGSQLDQIGFILAEPRGDKEDEEYRRHLRAAIRTYNSSGTVEDLITITKLVLDMDDAIVWITPGYPAGLTIEIREVVVTTELATALMAFLRRAVAATVKLVAVYWTTAESGMFTTDGGTGLGLGDSTDASVGGALAGALE